MEISISGRHFTVSEETKKHIEGKLLALADSYKLVVISAKVVLDLEKKNRAKVEASLVMKGHSFDAIEESYDMVASIDGVLDKIGIQMRRYVDKSHDHRHLDKDAKKIKEDGTEVVE